MDGFVKLAGAGRSGVTYQYFPSLELALRHGYTAAEWVAWDKAPPAWRAETVAKGGRGPQAWDANLAREGPVATGRDQADLGGVGALEMQSYTAPGSKGGMPEPTTAVHRLTNTDGTGFLDNNQGSGAGGAGRAVLGWLGKNWFPVLSAGAGLYDRYKQGEREEKGDELTEEAKRFAQQDWQSRQFLRDYVSNNFGDASAQRRPDLGAAFADPSNPFYQALPAGGPPLSRWDPATQRFVTAAPPVGSPDGQSEGLPEDWSFKNLTPLPQRRAKPRT